MLIERYGNDLRIGSFDFYITPAGRGDSEREQKGRPIQHSAPVPDGSTEFAPLPEVGGRRSAVGGQQSLITLGITLQSYTAKTLGVALHDLSIRC
jgi:hypothetical protein